MSLSVQIVSLARAKTQNDRIRVLQHVAYDKRFNPDQQAELRTLLEEARKAPHPNVHALRPILNPADICDTLVPLKHGLKPVLTKEQDDVIEEWLLGWTEEARLRGEKVLPPGPLLLAGPTGCGKTMLTGYIAARLAGVRSGVIVEAHKVVDSFVGSTGAKLAKAFEAANQNSGLIVVEEIDAFAEARTGGESGAERENNRISVSMMRLMETSSAAIIATTNRLKALDEALLRRFEYRIEFPLPDESIRRSVLTNLLGVEAPKSLVDLPLTTAVPLVSRIKRTMVLRSLSVEAAVETLKAA